MSIARIIALTLALSFVTATAFTSPTYAAEPVNDAKVKVSSMNGGTKPATPCCAGRRR